MNELKEQVAYIKKKLDLIRAEVAKAVVGQSRIVNYMIMGLLANGHILVEGVPGTAKTLIIRSISRATDTDFGRIQFTPDLLPTDIVGVMVYTGGASGGGGGSGFGKAMGGEESQHGFSVIKGPVFNNFVLADEINRASPKVQSALLEAMQEHKVTIGRKDYYLAEPLFVFATQNTLEQAGVYSLPEAQLDRFLFKIYIGYPTFDEEQEVLKKNITIRSLDHYELKKVVTAKELVAMQEVVRNVKLNEDIEKYIVALVDATRVPEKYGLEQLKPYVDYGASPRGGIAMFIGSKANAVIHGRDFVIPEDVQEIVHSCLRHRVILTYEAQAEGITTDDIISKLLEKVPVP